jgi:subtilisin family serine protease
MRRLAAMVVAAFLALPLPAHAVAQPRTWNFDQIRIGRAQSAGRSGSGVTVAVLDTWIDLNHVDFRGRMLAGTDCAGGSCHGGAPGPDGCEAHGTHVAGTIGSEYYGVAPAAKILPVRVLKWDGDECVGTSGDLARAIRWATAHGARIVNVSAGAAVPLAGRDATLDAAVADAADKGVLVVFAAGNANLPVADSYGGDALIVAATGRDGAIASYSQHGTGVDLAAPGGDPPGDTCTEHDCVVSTWSEGGKDMYAALAGTSMAAPHVSGVAALLYAQKTRSRANVVARLRDTARPLSGAGDGLIDAAAALGASAAPPTTAASQPPSSAPVVKLPPRTAPPVVRATPTPTPTPTPKPKPKKKKPKPTAAPTTAPPPASALVVTPPPQAEPPRQEQSRSVPVAAAALLLVSAAAGTVAVGRRPQL